MWTCDGLRAVHTLLSGEAIVVVAVEETDIGDTNTELLGSGVSRPSAGIDEGFGDFGGDAAIFGKGDMMTGADKGITILASSVFRLSSF